MRPRERVGAGEGGVLSMRIRPTALAAEAGVRPRTSAGNGCTKAERGTQSITLTRKIYSGEGRLVSQQRIARISRTRRERARPAWYQARGARGEEKGRERHAMTTEGPGVLMMLRLGCVEHGGRTQALSTSKYRLRLRISEPHTHGSSAEILLAPSPRTAFKFNVPRSNRLFMDSGTVALTYEQPVSFLHDGRVIFVRQHHEHCDYFTIFTTMTFLSCCATI